jgi:hypothetical protein
MKRILFTAALLLAVTPAVASAAPFGELPFRSAGGVAECLRATGYPGELVRGTPGRSADDGPAEGGGAQFLQATPGGLTPVADVPSEAATSGCPEVAARPSGAGIVAFAASSEFEREGFVRATLREPGATWGTRFDLAEAENGFADGRPLAVDISDRGDALVAFAASDEQRGMTISAARRDPGAGFGAAQTVATTSKRAGNQVRLAAGMTGAGEAVVAWAYRPVVGKPRELWAAIAPAGAAFGAPVKLATLRTGSTFDLAVGVGGHALLAFVSGDDVLVSERAPGAGFGPPARVGGAGDLFTTAPVAAVRADGGAVVAWSNVLAGDAHAVLRPQAGPFGAPVVLAPKSGFRYPKLILDLLAALLSDENLGEFVSGGSDDETSDPRASITPDGRAFVTWGGLAQRDGLWWGAPRAALVPLAGGPVQDETFGTELRDAGSVTALTTPDGVAGVAWTDNGDGRRDGRLHVALEGVAAAADAAPPKLTVLAPTRRVLKPTEPLRFGVRCAAACDVRVQAGEGALAPGESFSLRRAGERRISLDPSFEPLATLRGGPVTLHLRYGAPGARRATAKSVTYRLRRLPDAPRPKILNPVARRDGKKIVVTWRTDRDAKASYFNVVASKKRTATAEESFEYSEVSGSKRLFRGRLVDGGAARYVQIITQVEDARSSHTTTVRIRG